MSVWWDGLNSVANDRNLSKFKLCFSSDYCQFHDPAILVTFQHNKIFLSNNININVLLYKVNHFAKYPENSSVPSK